VGSPPGRGPRGPEYPLMWGLGGERPERALKCINTIIVLRDTVAWSMHV